MKFILTATLLILLSSCIEPKQAQNKSEIVTAMSESVSKQFPTIKHISIEEMDKLNKDEYILVDVRSPNELKVSIIPNSISKSEFEKNVNSYKSKKIVSYCTIGYRSSEYSKVLQDKGFNSYNLKGSILAWAMKKRPLISSGKETKKVHVYSDAWNFLPEGYTGVYK